MDNDLLHRGCERAGMEQEPDEDGRVRWVMPDDEWVLPPDHPALPSYVADLLVGMVRERNAPVFGRFCAAVAALIDEVGDPQDPEVGFTYTQLEGFLYYIDKKHIITAALEALAND